jgi:hypothetical protein
MVLTGRSGGDWRWLIASASLFAAFAAAAEPTVYHDRYDYVVPEPMFDKMTELAPIESWIHFPENYSPELTRFIDSDNDGASEFVAIALGAEGGFGAQIRYRLNYPKDGGQAELGSWYWCVITDSSGEKIFEQFNP